MEKGGRKGKNAKEEGDRNRWYVSTDSRMVKYCGISGGINKIERYSDKKKDQTMRNISSEI